MWVSNASGLALSGATPTMDVYNANNQNSNFTFDAAGNQLCVNSNPGCANGESLTYDAENRALTVNETPG
jgi:hypothetical protein